jgi:hypothetical protein
MKQMKQRKMPIWRQLLKLLYEKTFNSKHLVSSFIEDYQKIGQSNPQIYRDLHQDVLRIPEEPQAKRSKTSCGC